MTSRGSGEVCEAHFWLWSEGLLRSGSATVNWANVLRTRLRTPCAKAGAQQWGGPSASGRDAFATRSAACAEDRGLQRERR